MTVRKQKPTADEWANDALRGVDLSIPESGITTLTAESAQDAPWCICGNEQTHNVSLLGDHVGPLCEPFLTGPLNTAYEAFNLIRTEWGMCCGGLSSDVGSGRSLAERIQKFSTVTHLYIHPKQHGESSYYIPSGYCLDCGHAHTAEDGSCISPISTGDGPNDVDTCPCNDFRPPATREADMWVECGVRLYADHALPYWIFDNDKIDSHAELFGDEVPYVLTGEEFLARLAGQLSDAARVAYMSDHALCPECHGTYFVPNGPCCGDDEEEDTDVEDTDYQKTYHFKLECTVTLDEKPDPPETLTYLLGKELLKQLMEADYGTVGYMIDHDSIYTDEEDDEE